MIFRAFGSRKSFHPWRGHLDRFGQTPSLRLRACGVNGEKMKGSDIQMKKKICEGYLGAWSVNVICDPVPGGLLWCGRWMSRMIMNSSV